MGKKSMSVISVVMVIAWFSFVPSRCVAQEVVHAVTGTVSATNPASHTISVRTDDGSEGLFKDRGTIKADISFDKRIEAQAQPADEFTKVGSNVIVYYIGDNDVRTAVAVKNLGAASTQNRAGTVAKFDRHRHLLTLKSDAGGTEEVVIDEQTSVDTADGVIEGLKYEAKKGEHVRVISTTRNGQDTALFIYAT